MEASVSVFGASRSIYYLGRPLRARRGGSLVPQRSEKIPEVAMDSAGWHGVVQQQHELCDF